jgi:hypothetical protein
MLAEMLSRLGIRKAGGLPLRPVKALTRVVNLRALPFMA